MRVCCLHFVLTVTALALCSINCGLANARSLGRIDVEKFTLADFKKLMRGVMKGAFKEEFPIAEECFSDGIKMIEKIEIAVEDIKEGTNKSVKEGVQLIGQIIQEAATEEKTECESATKEFGQLIDMAKLMAHPMSFLYHAGHNIVINQVEIKDEVEAAIESWDKEPKDFYDVGFNIGEAIEQVFVGYFFSTFSRNGHFTANDLKKLTKGILRGAFQEEFAIAEECFKDEFSIVETIEVAVKDIKEGSKESVEKGVKLIGQAVREVATKGRLECESATHEFDQLITMAKLLAHPLSFLYHAGHNIVINHVEIKNEVDTAIESWDEEPKDFYDVGFNIGKALVEVFVGYESSSTLAKE